MHNLKKKFEKSSYTIVPRMMMMMLIMLMMPMMMMMMMMMIFCLAISVRRAVTKGLEDGRRPPAYHVEAEMELF